MTTTIGLNIDLRSPDDCGPLAELPPGNYAIAVRGLNGSVLGLTRVALYRLGAGRERNTARAGVGVRQGDACRF